MFKSILYSALNVCLFIFGLWSTIAIYFINLPNVPLAIIASVVFAFIVLSIFFFRPQSSLSRGIIILLYGMVLIGWNNMQPSNNRDWMPSVARSPHATIEGNTIKIFDIRNFDYQTENDFIENYYDKTYHLDDLDNLSFLLSYWDGGTAVAHTILSFGFKNGDYLAVSAETRQEKGEPQELIQGFFNQYEMIYILADERDIIRLRTNFRKEEVFFYPTKLNKQEVRQIFDVIISRVNKLYHQAEFYNTLTHNCFTTLRADFSTISPSKNRFDWRILANGYADEMLYENDDIDTNLSFPETKKFFHINQYVSGDNNPENFSKRIRPDLSQNESK